MGQKGDRASKEPLALRLYADGLPLSEISRQLDVSDTTLRKWKQETLPRGEEVDAWDRARQQKRGNIQRLRDLFERQMEYMEGVKPSAITSGMVDALSKLGALIERWDKAEAVVKKLAELEKSAESGDKTISVDLLKKVRQEIYGVA